MRYIDIEVANEYVKGAGVPIGAAGSYSDVALRIRFSSMWDGMAKHITWLDANGENPTIVYLTAENYEDGCYTSLIPAEAKAVAGIAVMSIKGADESKGTLTAKAEFKVLESVYDSNAEEAVDPTPTVAEQLQAEIEQIIDEIGGAAQAATDAAASAAAAALSESAAAGSATEAESYAKGGTNTRTGEDTDNARYYKEQAEAAAEQAIAVVGVAPATELPLADGTAAVGTSGKYARQDHVHPETTQPATETPLADGTAAVGTSTKFAREDHVHPAVKETFIATYADTPIADIVAAVDAGKLVFCRYDDEYGHSYLLPLTTDEYYGGARNLIFYAYAAPSSEIRVTASYVAPGGEGTSHYSRGTTYLATKDFLNRSTAVNAADTNYTTVMARGISLHSTETTPTVNGAIAFQYG